MKRDPCGRQPPPEAEDAQALGQALLTFYAQASTSLVELWLNPPKFTVRISDKPTASPLARLQAATKNRVTNLRHESVFLGEFERRLVRLLDGTHDRAALLTALIALVEKGDLTVEKDSQTIKEGVQLRELIADAAERQLKTIASNVWAENLLLVHFSACLMLEESPAGDLARKLQRLGRFPVSGYTTSVDWAASAILEFTYFDLILARGLEPADAAQYVHRLLTFAGEAGHPQVGFPAAGFRFLTS